MNIFLLRGLIREKEHWYKFPQKLQKSFKNHSIYLMEIPGVGQKCKTISPSNFKDMVLNIRQEFQSLFTPENNNIIISISLGGMISREWIKMFPKDFSHAVFINSSFKGLSPFYRRLRAPSLISFINFFLTTNMEKREKKILELVSNNKTEHIEVLEHWIDIQKKRPVLIQSFFNQLRAAIFYNPPLNKFNTKLLTIAGKGDRLCHYSCSEKIYQTWGGQLELHDSAGHDLSTDEPDWLIEKIKSWLS